MIKMYMLMQHKKKKPYVHLESSTQFHLCDTEHFPDIT